LIVVADTSPILNLERIGRLNVLQALYAEIVIPEAVSIVLPTPDESIVMKFSKCPAVAHGTMPTSSALQMAYLNPNGNACR